MWLNKKEERETLRGCSSLKTGSSHCLQYISLKEWKMAQNWAKNETFMLKPNILRLREGQVSSIWVIFLRLGKGQLLLSEGVRLGELETHLLLCPSFFSFASLKLSLCLGDPLHLGEVVLMGKFCFLTLFAIFFACFTFYSCKT